jgi:hypothetical protein
MDDHVNDFETIVRKQGSSWFLLEIWQFLKHSRKWWLVPVLLTLLLLAMLLVMSGSALTPFLYTLF